MLHPDSGYFTEYVAVGRRGTLGLPARAWLVGVLAAAARFNGGSGGRGDKALSWAGGMHGPRLPPVVWLAILGFLPRNALPLPALLADHTGSDNEGDGMATSDGSSDDDGEDTETEDPGED